MQKNYYIILIFVLLLSISLLSCNQGNNEEENMNENQDEQEVASPESQRKSSGELDFLKEYSGKYPYEVKLLENNVLVKRMKALLGDRFEFLKDTWAVENPMVIKDEYFIADGCMAHNCNMTNFIIIVDLDSDILYVGIREDNVVKKYAEQGSPHPKQMEDWEKNIY